MNDTSVSGVPSSVYIIFICLECAGIIVAAALMDPAKLRRDDGRPIAAFVPLPWMEEFKSLAKTILDQKMALLTVSIYSSEMYLSMTGSFNAYYFNARTRALANVSAPYLSSPKLILMTEMQLCYWIFQVLGALLIAWACDTKLLRTRRQRAFAAAGLVFTIIGGTWIAMIAFLASNNFDRNGTSPSVDWTETSRFAGPFVIYIFFGACYPLFQNFHHWTYSTFSNEPHILGRYSGYFKGVQAWGTATAFGIDSHGVAFLHEAVAYFVLMIVGLALSTTSIYKYTTNTNYGVEDGVVIPKEFEDVTELKGEELIPPSEVPAIGDKAAGQTISE